MLCLLRIEWDTVYVCVISNSGQSANRKITHVFLVAGRWFTVDFDLKTNFYGGKLGTMGGTGTGTYLFMKPRKKVKTRIGIIA